MKNKVRIPITPFTENIKDLFMLTVADNGLKEWNIPEGSIIICKKQTYAENGKIAVMLKEDNETIEIARITYLEEKRNIVIQTPNDVEALDYEEFNRIKIIGQVVSFQIEI